MTRVEGKKRHEDAAARLEERETKEAEVAKETLEKLKTLSAPIKKTEK